MFEESLRQGKLAASRIRKKEKDVLITVFVKESFREKVREKAKAKGVNISAYLRLCLEKFLKS